MEPPQATPEPTLRDDVPLVPARMVNEYVYCKRLAYLMWGQAEWTDTADTAEGRYVHRRADRPGAPLPAPEALDAGYRLVVSRSVTLSSEELGLVAKIDIAEIRDGGVTVVDYKRGKRPHGTVDVWEPEKVQLCLQALLLEAHGYTVHGGMIWFAESRERVGVSFDHDLRARSLEALSGLRRLVAEGTIPPPLVDSPKCPRCALVSVCLPDEVNCLGHPGADGGEPVSPRPIAIPIDESFPLVIQSPLARVGKDGDRLRISEEDGPDTFARLIDISDVALFGTVNLTSPALTTLMDRGVPVTFHTHGGWFYGMASGLGHRNVEVRTAQYAMSFDQARCLAFARSLVAAKIHNQRTMVRRNWRADEAARGEVMGRMAVAARRARRAQDGAALLGLEGDGASAYFRAFASLLHPPPRGTRLGHAAAFPPEGEAVPEAPEGEAVEPAMRLPFQFDKRNRRPPLDPVNAMLSLGYAMLTRHFTVALASVGLDPFRGFFHTSRYGRPALALDLMEPFRPIIADSVVLTLVNTGEIRPSDFISGATGTALTASGRRRFIEAFDRRLGQQAAHPLFTYHLSLRRLILVQARLLTRFLLGELAAYPHYLPR